MKPRLCLFAAFAVLNLAASENHFDANGRLDRIAVGAGWIDMLAQVKVATDGWAKTFALDRGKVEFAESNGKKNWLGRIGDGESIDVEIVQTVSEGPNGLSYEIKASALRTSDMEALVFWIDLPSDLFAKGMFRTDGKDGAIGPLPAEVPARHILSSGLLEGVRLDNPDKSISFHAQFGTPANATLQDTRKWSKHFSLLLHIFQGTLYKGQSASISFTLRASGAPDQTPAEFKLDPATPLFPVLGLGGNYCFNLDTPERDHTLAQLKPRYARTEISLQQWQPSLGAPPKLDAGKLPLEFKMMRDLAALKIPFIASVWQAPPWACRQLETTENGQPIKFTAIRPEAWEDLIDSIGAYLMNAKSNHQAEPDYFSFNETDYGAKVRMTAEEHRDLIRRAGAHFEKLGLKTRCLLGDVSNPRVSLDYLKPALDDPQAMKYVGAIAFHSWGGAAPTQYAAWSDLAQRLKLPLIVAEAGVDPAAWKDNSYRSFEYALREMSHYQELFLYARPQSILYWEFTADYSLMASNELPKDKRGETERFAFQKHWLNFIPPGSKGLSGSGTNGQIMLTAFRVPGEKDAQNLTLNLSNSAWPRKVRITGIPADVNTLNAIQTSQGVLFKTLTPITPANGTVEIELPARSLTTLTTLQ